MGTTYAPAPRRRVGDFVVDLADQSIWREQDLLRVTPKAAAIFCYLVENAGRLIGYPQIRQALQAIWPGTAIQPSTLKVYIFELRRVLGDEAASPKYIKTVPRRGYRLIAPVSDAGRGPVRHEDRGASSIFGREHEVRELLALLRSAQQGRRQMAFLSGEQGIGKSALMRDFLAQAAALPGVSTALGQTVRAHTRIEPYYPVLDALARLDVPGFRQALKARAPAWLERLPSFWERGEPVGEARMLLPVGRMLREICALLESFTAEHMLVLAIEDLEWADDFTIDFLSAIARRREAARLLIVCAQDCARPSVSSPAAALSRELGVRQLCYNLVLRPLSEDDVRLMLFRIWGDRAAADRFAVEVAAYAGGNPLYVTAIAGRLKAHPGFTLGELAGKGFAEYWPEVPPSLQELILVRFDALSPTQQLLLECATLAGEPFSAAALATVAGIPPDEAQAECEELAGDLAVLHSAGAQQLPEGHRVHYFAFRHGLFRDVVASRTSVGKRTRTQVSVAQALEQIYGKQQQRTWQVVASRFEHERVWDHAIQHLQAAAADAILRHSPAEASRLLARARADVLKLEGSARRESALFELLLQLAPVSMAALDARTASAAWAELAALAGTEAAQRRLAGVMLPASAGGLGFDYALAFDLAARLAEAGARLADLQLMELGHFERAFLTLVLRQWTPEGFDLCQDKIARIQATLPPAETAPWISRYAYLLAQTSDHRAARRMAATGKRLAQLQGDLFAACLSAASMSQALLSLGRWNDFLAHAASFIAWAKKRGSGSILSFAEAQLPLLWLECFQFERVFEFFTAGQPPAVRHQFAAQHAAACIARAYAGLRQYRLALKVVEKAQSAAAGLMPLPFKVILHHAAVDSHLALGDHAAAAREARQLIELTESAEDHASQTLGWVLLSRCRQADGDIAAAQENVERGVALVRRYRLPRAAWRVAAQASRCYFEARLPVRAQQYREQALQEITRLAAGIHRDPALGRTFLAGAREELGLPERLVQSPARRPGE